jgi:hypothetical protein
MPAGAGRGRRGVSDFELSSDRLILRPHEEIDVEFMIELKRVLEKLGFTRRGLPVEGTATWVLAR